MAIADTGDTCWIPAQCSQDRLSLHIEFGQRERQCGFKSEHSWRSLVERLFFQVTRVRSVVGCDGINRSITQTFFESRDISRSA